MIGSSYKQKPAIVLKIKKKKKISTDSYKTWYMLLQIVFLYFQKHI